MTDLIIDNWMLQDANVALELGLSPDTAAEIEIDAQHDKHSFRNVPYAVFQIDALLTLLVDIVFRDKLIVDDRYMSAWYPGAKSLASLKDNGIIVPFDFKKSEEKWADVIQSIVGDLCVTKSILKIQKKNEKVWNEYKESYDPHMSQLVWGTAGYLARSNVYHAPYSGCLPRRALIRQSTFVGYTKDSIKNAEEIINTKRVQLFRSANNNKTSNYANLILPPVVVEVIRDSNDVDDLIPIALQLRDKYQKLREWLNQYQTAIDQDDPKSMLNHVKVLESIAKNIDRDYSILKDGSVNVSVGYSLFGVGIPVEGIANYVRNRFGVRALLNNLVFEPDGGQAILRLLKMFGEVGHKFTFIIQKELIKHYSE
jgi:hypothetical protein